MGGGAEKRKRGAEKRKKGVQRRGKGVRRREKKGCGEEEKGCGEEEKVYFGATVQEVTYSVPMKENHLTTTFGV